MARVFITGSADGLGLMAAQLLVEQGHRVVLHGRNAARADHLRALVPQAEAVLEADVSTVAGARQLAAQADAVGHFDAVIHNVAVGYREPRRIETADGLPHVFATNVLAPYVLTALMQRPGRLVYLTSGLQHGAKPVLDDLLWERRRWVGNTAYAESKLYDTVLAFAVARRWPDVPSNTVEPGWVATRMGGPGARDDLDQAHRTQVWLAASDGPVGTGRNFFHGREKAPNPAARDPGFQEELLARCAALSGVSLPD